ncbi:Uncharacterised protein [Mycobacteroides abscessus subsp. abscessus]|nr:Uncharacterised protein [Mycobacteroides abscessus subsp. abscessus]
MESRWSRRCTSASTFSYSSSPPPETFCALRRCARACADAVR